MSGSEPGIMSGRESFGIGLQKNQIPSQNSGLPNMRLAYSSDGTAVYKPVTVNSPTYHTTTTTTTTGGSTAPVGGGGGVGDGQMVQLPQQGINMNMGEPMKRKRGRPRKYGPDGSMSLSLPPPQAAGGAASSPPVQPPTGFSSSPPLSASPSSTPALKKGRGRPLGSGKKQQMDALGSAGLGFTPHVITVKAGEDVSAKIMSFSQHGSRAVCILSANGAISNVTLRQAATSGGTVTYEGRFEILSLSGSFLYSETGGQRSRTGGLSVSLAGPDGRVLGGGVGGMLTAASPVQVVVGSFIVDSHKESKLLNQSEPSSAPHKLPVGGGGGGGGTSGAASSPPSTSSGGPGSPLNQSTGAFNSNNAPGMANISWK